MPHTLLLADDSVTIQRVIELTFADEDVQVVAVSDGEQAIAALDRKPPDIVLADVGMPGRNGYEVAQHIKTTPRLAHIPVVLLTGAFEPVDQAKADGGRLRRRAGQAVRAAARHRTGQGAAGKARAATRLAPNRPRQPQQAAPAPAPTHRLANDHYFERARSGVRDADVVGEDSAT